MRVHAIEKLLNRIDLMGERCHWTDSLGLNVVRMKDEYRCKVLYRRYKQLATLILNTLLELVLLFWLVCGFSCLCAILFSKWTSV
mgnify:CR=1 FL=1